MQNISQPQANFVPEPTISTQPTAPTPVANQPAAVQAQSSNYSSQPNPVGGPTGPVKSGFSLEQLQQLVRQPLMWVIVLVIFLGVSALFLLNRRERASVVNEPAFEEPLTETDADAEPIEMSDLEAEAEFPESEAETGASDAAVVNTTGTANLILSCGQSSYTVGESVSCAVALKTAELPDGAEFLLTYDSSLLSAVTLTPGTAFANYLVKKVNPDTGKIKVTVVRNPAEQPALNEVIELATITGTAAQAGQLALNFDLAGTVVAANGGQNILSQPTNLVITIN